METKSNLAAWIGSTVSVLTLFGAVILAWHSLGVRIAVLELQATDAKADHQTLEKLKSVILAKNPDTLQMLGSKSQSAVHNFGVKMFEAGVAADAAEMPRVGAVPVLAAPEMPRAQPEKTATRQTRAQKAAELSAQKLEVVEPPPQNFEVVESGNGSEPKRELSHVEAAAPRTGASSTGTAVPGSATGEVPKGTVQASGTGVRGDTLPTTFAKDDTVTFVKSYQTWMPSPTNACSSSGRCV